jgi:hypothetical protein
VIAKRTRKDELQTIPGIGPSLARDLRDLGIERAAYYARTPRPAPRLLQWWHRKDRRLPAT